MIAIKNLKVNLGDFMLQDINLNIKPGEYFIILGPTGAGKTVLLEAIAGLYPILEGEIWSDGREITRLKPEKRGISIVYQDQVLFPHFSVEKNIAFGLKMRKCPKQEIKPRIEKAVELVGITHLLQRRPTTLSGGEKQRVALARALVTEPEVLLLDEPLSALDPETKERLQQELADIHCRISISNKKKMTILQVTHDFEEAVALGHRVAVLNNGRIAQVGTPEEVLRQPQSEFVAHFALSRNIFRGYSERRGEVNPHPIPLPSRERELKELPIEGGECSFIDIGGTKLVAVTEKKGDVRLSLRPEDILLSQEPLQSTARNSFQGTVTQIINRGIVLYVTVNVPSQCEEYSGRSLELGQSTRIEGHDFTCLITRQSLEELELRKGVRVWLTFKASAVHVF